MRNCSLSMEEPPFHKGDMLIADRAIASFDGRIVVVMYDPSPYNEVSWIPPQTRASETSKDYLIRSISERLKRREAENEGLRKRSR